MSIEEFNKFVSEVTTLVLNRPECLRLGQATFNYAYKKLVSDMDYETVNSMKTFSDKEIDPFYDDELVNKFWQSLYEDLVKN